MRPILSTIISLVLAISVLPVAFGRDTVVIDMRHGLPESRIRGLLPLPDGRLAIATAGYISVFDGASFVSEPINPEKGIKLISTANNRQLFRDSRGYIWLKMPVTHNEATSRLYAFDPLTVKEVTDGLLEGVELSSLKDFFADEKGRIWLIDYTDNLLRYEDGVASPLLRLDNISRELPACVSGQDSTLYLCYDNGKVCEIDIASGLLRSMSAPHLPDDNIRIANGAVKWNNGVMWVAYQRRDNKSGSWLAAFDSRKREWSVERVASPIDDFAFTPDDSLLIGGKKDGEEIFAIASSPNGSLWLGTRNSGLRYISRRDSNLITLAGERYRHPRNGYFSSDRAKELSARYASGILNCSASDSIAGYVYLGTRKGLIVVDANDKVVATLDAESGGLPNSNVQSILANVGAHGSVAGDVWFSTATGFSRLRHLGGDTVEIINLGLLDGLDLEGSELPSQRMVCDSSGLIIAGYPGGTIRFNPREVEDDDYVKHRYPSSILQSGSDNFGGRGVLLIILLCIAVGGGIAILSYRKSRRANSNDNNGYEPVASAFYPVCDTLMEHCKGADGTQVSTSADVEFAEKLRLIVSEKLGDENLNVVTLSQHMAMDRTNLYRRMQAVLGVSPSVYIKNMRLAAAARLLRETSMSVPEIATLTGFSSAKYFSSTFKDSFGVLPSAYRSSGPPIPE